ncbi:MAG: acylphosphatase [Candidatus Omnitrophica bacterium]|nr:acylphosphatase [Candidatus Omnitrophota bacterium]
MKRVHVFYSGRVQGVGFRFTAENLASKLEITGWVKNMHDGRVEILAEGKQENLEKFLKEINAYFANYIKDSETHWLEATGEFKGFGIKF